MTGVTSIVDLADQFGCTRDDANNALKRFVDPELVPSAAAGQLRYMSRHLAVILGFAIVARDAGFSPEQVRVITKTQCSRLQKPDAVLALLTGEGGCSVLTTVELEGSIDSVFRAYTRQPVDWLRVVNLALVHDRVDRAIKCTEAKSGIGPAPKLKGKFGEKPSQMVEFQKRRAKASKKEPVA